MHSHYLYLPVRKTEEDEEVVGFEEWRVGASEELRIKLYKSGMRCIIAELSRAKRAAEHHG